MTHSRTCTLPADKWLVNELAATAGEMVSIDEEVARLTARRARLAATHQALFQVVEIVGASALAGWAQPVRAHGRYGGRGRLRGWLKQVLQNAAPGAVTTTALVVLAQESFGLAFSSAEEQDRFRRDSLTRQLRGFLQQGLVERVHDVAGGVGRVGVWRWKEVVPSLEELVRRAAPEKDSPWP